MVRHEQSGDHLTLYDMPFHDLCHVSFRADPVPDPFRIDDHAGSQFAMVQAAGLVCAHNPFEIQAFGLTLKVSMELF